MKATLNRPDRPYLPEQADLRRLRQPVQNAMLAQLIDSGFIDFATVCNILHRLIRSSRIFLRKLLCSTFADTGDCHKRQQHLAVVGQKTQRIYRDNLGILKL